MQNKLPVVDRLSLAVGNGLSLLFLVAVLLTALEVLLRYGFNSPTIWVHDMVILLSALCFIFGGALASQQQNHIEVASFAGRAPARVRSALALASRWLSALFLALFVYASITQAIPALEVMETSGHAWDVPIPAFLKTVLVIGAVLMLAQTLSHIWHRTPPPRPPTGAPPETFV